MRRSLAVELSASDRFAIADIVAQMLHAIDAVDWKAVRAAFAERVDVDYTSLFGGEPTNQAADDLILGWQGLVPGFEATQHLLGPIAVCRQGAGAVAETHVRAYHYVAAGRVWMVAGHYAFRLLRQKSWKIAAITLTTYYQEGNLGLLDRARERAKTSPRARSSRLQSNQ
jgi:hypothetical protein